MEVVFTIYSSGQHHLKLVESEDDANDFDINDIDSFPHSDEDGDVHSHQELGLSSHGKIGRITHIIRELFHPT